MLFQAAQALSPHAGQFNRARNLRLTPNLRIALQCYVERGNRASGFFRLPLSTKRSGVGEGLGGEELQARGN